MQENPGFVVHFNRTYGADYSEGSEYKVAEAAEVIDLNSAAYLFGMDEATKNNQPRTVYVHSVAPRY